jgi:hypothetical protein
MVAACIQKFPIACRRPIFHTDKIYRSAIVLAYKIFGSQPGFAEGLLFYSCVPDLQSQPDLWLDECPYLQPQVSPTRQTGLRVELVATEDKPLQTYARPTRLGQAQRALAA